MPRTNLTIKLPSGEIVKMGACKQAKVKTKKLIGNKQSQKI